MSNLKCQIFVTFFSIPILSYTIGHLKRKPLKANLESSFLAKVIFKIFPNSYTYSLLYLSFI